MVSGTNDRNGEPMKNDRIPSLCDDPDLWIGLLADNELTPDQRRLLVQHLDNHPDQWRQCAIAMMDQQFLTGNAGISAFETKTVRLEKLDDRESMRPFSRKAFPQLIAAIAAAVLVFCAGFAIDNQISKRHYEKQLAQAELNSRATIDMLSDLYCSTIGQSSTPTQLQDIFSNRPTLIELESNEFESIWLTDRQVPDSFLEMLVGSGKSVEIKPYKPRLMTSAMRTFQRPLIAVEVKNTSSINLLAHGEVQ